MCVATLVGGFWALPLTAFAQPAETTTSTGELAYLVLVGEMQVAAQKPHIGYSLLMEAARKSGDAGIYRRAIAVAMQMQSFVGALDAAKAWAKAQPQDPEPLRFMVQLLVSTQRLDQSRAPLAELLQILPADERNAAINMAAHVYARAQDTKLAAEILKGVLGPWAENPTHAPHAWAALGTLANRQGDANLALGYLDRALSSNPLVTAAGLLAVDLASQGKAKAEELLQNRLNGQSNVPSVVRVAYARHLLASGKLEQAKNVLTPATQSNSDEPDAWLLLAAIDFQQNQWGSAQAHFTRYLTAVEAVDTEQALRGKTQAYLALAQIAEKQNDFKAAEGWLQRIDPGVDPLPANVRRASMLAQQGQWEAARSAIRQTPVEDKKSERARWLAEVQMLRSSERNDLAYATLQAAIDSLPGDAELIYELAMVAEKLGRVAEMEQTLRDLIAQQPDYHHAYNALGYSWADRNVNLDEAKELILKALEMAPGDPFIIDSLGWVEYRLGNLQRAAELLQEAYAKRADTEIAVHLGEVLWALGKQTDAREVLRQAQTLDANSALLKNLLSRLGISL